MRHFQHLLLQELQLDRFGPYVIAAFAISMLVLGLYGMYLYARLAGLRRHAERLGPGEPRQPGATELT
jgi:hypothetical protein